MPEIRHYKVRETREVEVRANSAADAAAIAEAAFKNGQNSVNGVKDGPLGIWGNTTTRVRQMDMEVKAVR